MYTTQPGLRTIVRGKYAAEQARIARERKANEHREALALVAAASLNPVSMPSRESLV